MTSRVDALAAVVGLALVVLGVALMHAPAACIVAGVGLIAFAAWRR